ncbi:MAG: hypothetical protein GYA55_04455 [SAR324 cluster bacterium]|uniref:Uncharacterized protein n=1 Tax=SAR324 cluster bacterium TaxID=2024889 RepID=A0A7X9IJT6_9DELT|nr:hypothetical protein [SAR324 cluster bacterium]
MTDLRFIETITQDLISAIGEDGFIAPEHLKKLSHYSEQELKSIRNCYRVMTAKIKAIPRGDELLHQVLSAAENTKDPDLLSLVKKLSHIGRNDKEIKMGLRGALHCFSHSLRKNRLNP